MTLPAPSKPDVVDALTGMPVLTHPETGQLYAIKPAWPHFWARALDSAIVIAAAVILMITLYSQATNYALGTASEALLSNAWLMFAAMAAVWFGTIFLYGMICGSPVGSIGDQVVGLREVLITDGTRAGVFRGGWRAVRWSMVPFALLVLIGGIFTDSGYASTDLPLRDSRFVGVDTRSGLAQGMEPVPAPEPEPKRK